MEIDRGGNVGTCTGATGAVVCRCRQRQAGRALRRGSPRSRLPIVGLILAAAVTLSGCATLYPHSPREEKATTELKAGLDSAQTAHLAAIDRHRTWLSEAIAKERQLVARRELARRDQVITSIMEDRAESRALLEDAIERRFDELANTALSGVNLPSFANASDNLADAQEDLGEALARRDQQVRLAGLKKPYCDELGVRTDPAGPTDPTLETICKRRIARYAGEVAKAYQTAGPLGAALLGDDRAVGALGPRSDLRLAIEEVSYLRTLLVAQRAIAGAAQTQLKDLTTYYECERKREAAPRPSARIAEIATEIRDFARFLAELDEAKLESAADQPVPGDPAPDACVRPERIDTAAGLVAKAKKDAPGLTMADIRRALVFFREANKELRVADTLLAAIQQDAQTFRAGKLSDVLDGLADPTPGAQTEPAAIIAAASARLLDNLDRLEAATSGTLPDTSGVLVRIAAARMRTETARIEAERLSTLAELAGLRIAALRYEAASLLNAQATLTTRGANSADLALLRYSNAWSSGRMPAAVLAADMKNANYMSWVRRERAVVEATYGILQPVASELQTYGAGGYRAADIARFLQAAGLAAVAGTN